VNGQRQSLERKESTDDHGAVFQQPRGPGPNVPSSGRLILRKPKVPLGSGYAFCIERAAVMIVALGRGPWSATNGRRRCGSMSSTIHNRLGNILCAFRENRSTALQLARHALNVTPKIPLTDITLSQQTDPYANAQSDHHHDRAASDRPTGHVAGGICALGIGSTVHHKASPETDEAFVFLGPSVSISKLESRI
jgi:hypothetical protein